MAAEFERLVHTAELAHARSEHGDFNGIGELLRALRAANTAATTAWAGALQAQVWLAFPALLPAPDLASVERALEHSSPERATHAAALRCALELALGALIGFERAQAERVAAAVATLDGTLEPDARARVLLIRAIAALARGDASAVELAECAARDAAEARAGGVLVQAMALRALGLSAQGDIDAALALARRASLMGRSEAIPQAEFLAHLCLARLRRLARQPHLALRVLYALRGVVTPPFRAWLGWEWLWAGGDELAIDSDLALAPAGAAGASLTACRAVLDGAQRGDRAAFAAACASLRQSHAGFAPIASEASELIAAIDLEQPVASAALLQFRSGESALTPAALHGLRLRRAEDDAGDSATAYVFAAPGQAPARVLHWGTALIANTGARIKQSQRTHGRVEGLLATALLAGPAGIDEERCFAETYGFAFEPELHRGVFDVLLHRARSALGDAATLTRAEGRLKLEPATALLLPDPRTSQRTTDRVLRLLSQRGRASAKDTAEGLRISLRAAQAALKRLSDTGACDSVRDGRGVEYAVEDTVFSEPTQRLSAERIRL